jgi:hypothetical protein
LDETVLARAYGLAFPASIGGIVAGSLIAAPLVTLIGLSGALAAMGGIVAAYAIFLCLPAIVRPARPPVVANPVPVSTV